MIKVAAKCGLKVHEVIHNRGIGNINWNEVTIKMSFYSNSFKHQLHFLNALVSQQAKFPEILGREFIKDHEVVYKAFDEIVKQKRMELEDAAKQKKEQYPIYI